MCVRFTVWELSEFMDYYILDKPVNKKVQPRYNAAPGQDLPVITREKKNKLNFMRFGLIPAWAKDEKIGYKLLNARAESIFDKPTWKNLVTKNRCLVPTNGFYEWSGEKPDRQPYFIHEKKRSLFSMAGLYNSWTNRKTGEIFDTFSIITTGPNKEMTPIHDRMPVILHRDDEDNWLNQDNNTPDILEEFLIPYDNNALEIYPVSKDVGNVKNDSPKLIKKLET